jgi:hypothetical protein
VSLTGDTKKRTDLQNWLTFPAKEIFGSLGWQTPEGGHRRRANSTVATPVITATLNVLVWTLLGVFSIKILCVIFPPRIFQNRTVRRRCIGVKNQELKSGSNRGSNS